MTLLYPERRLIVVVGDDEVEVVRRATTENAASKGARDFVPLVGALGAGAVMIPGIAVGAMAVQQLWKLRARSDSANLPYLAVTNSQAKNLKFPYGHPRRNVVYAADPGVAGNYYPIASFHRVLFVGKVAEALRLLRSLGATEISIEYLEGFDRGAGVDFSISPPESAGVEIGGGVKATNKASSGAKITMQLSPTMPMQIPKDLIWFSSEPLWQELANARLESGLRAFTIDVNYTDDFGINASLKAKIASVGLELGGTFTEYRETVWKLSATFAEQVPPYASSE